MVMTSESNVKRSWPQHYDAQFRELALTMRCQSLLGAAVFCQREGINPKTFYRWRRHLTPRAAVVLVPVARRDDVAAALSGRGAVDGSHDAAGHQLELELHLKNGRRIQGRMPVAPQNYPSGGNCSAVSTATFGTRSYNGQVQGSYQCHNPIGSVALIGLLTKN
jgi:hypothetical protein